MLGTSATNLKAIMMSWRYKCEYFSEIVLGEGRVRMITMCCIRHVVAVVKEGGRSMNNLYVDEVGAMRYQPYEQCEDVFYSA